MPTLQEPARKHIQGNGPKAGGSRLLNVVLMQGPFKAGESVMKTPEKRSNFFFLFDCLNMQPAVPTSRPIPAISA